MENKDLTEVEEKRKLFYGLGADGSLVFQGEEPIPVTRTIIAFHSSVFRNEFFGPEPKTQIEIQRFDRATIKLFLDCLLGLKEYTLLDALVIYPIAKEYKVTESQIKCVAALKPEVMDENVPLVLNLSVFYEEHYLTEHVIDFIKTKCGIIDFFENEKYCCSLDLSAMCKLIENIDLNSVIWTLVYQWGEKYLKDRNKSDIKSFFLEIGILEKISLSHFESMAAVFKFHKISKMQFFSNEEVFRLVENNLLKSPKILPDKSDWIKIDAGYNFKELIVFRHYLPVNFTKFDEDLDIAIRPNYVLIRPGASVSTVLKVKARYIYRLFNLRSIENPRPTWRNDLNNYYREKLTSGSKEEICISSLTQSKEFDMILTNDGKEPVYKFLVKLGLAMECHAVEVTYKFNSSCRILKASLDTGIYSVDKDNLYFTKNVTIVKKINENKDSREKMDHNIVISPMSSCKPSAMSSYKPSAMTSCKPSAMTASSRCSKS